MFQRRNQVVKFLTQNHPFPACHQSKLKLFLSYEFQKQRLDMKQSKTGLVLNFKLVPIARSTNLAAFIGSRRVQRRALPER